MKGKNAVNPYLDAILGAASKSQAVKINIEKLDEYAQIWAQEDLPIPDWRMPVYLEADDNAFIQFLGIGNALNYCFSNPKTKQKYETEYLGKLWRGAFGMWAALKRAHDEGVPILDPNFLERIDTEEVKHIFTGNPELPMFRARANSLRLAGQALLNNFGSYAELFRRCDYRAFNSGIGIIDKLVRHDSGYSDTAFFKPTNTVLRFHKRANLFVMMYHGRALSSNGALPPIKDAEDLTPPADYEVPKALRHLGILEYSLELANAVDSGIEIPAHSQWEQEIRSQTVAAMVSLCQKSGKSITAIDFKVWLEGKSSLNPHHLTATTAY